MTERTYNVLFLCTGNSARSILAECALDRLGRTLLDPQLAPAGGHVMSILAQFVPPLRPNGVNGAANGRPPASHDRLADIVIDTLAQYAPDLRQVVVGRKVLTPADLELEYSLTGGHLMHGEPALDQLFAFRPLVGCAQYRSPIERLYLCGSGTHPGGVISGASGANASREIIKDLRA